MRFVMSCYEDGWLPTVRDVAAHMGIAINAAQQHIYRLRVKGWLGDSSRICLGPLSLNRIDISFKSFLR